MTTITIDRALLEQALEALELVTEDYDDSAVGLEIEAILAIRAELAKPVLTNDSWHFERLDRLLSTCLSEPAYSDYLGSLKAVAGTQAEPPTPAWHDAPTEPGLWACLYQGEISTTIFNAYEIENFDVEQMKNCRWYGPIPQGKEGGEA